MYVGVAPLLLAAIKVLQPSVDIYNTHYSEESTQQHSCIVLLLAEIEGPVSTLHNARNRFSNVDSYCFVKTLRFKDWAKRQML